MQTSQCSLIELIKDNVTPVMSLLKQHIPDYNFDEETKCLYTAVMVMALYLGRSASQITSECDVHNVNTKYDKFMKGLPAEVNPSVAFLSILKKDIFQRAGRFLYYIMITNEDVPVVDNPNNKIMFPGHVMVIEKQGGTFKIYQSYISVYTLKGAHQRNNNSFDLSPNLLRNLVDELIAMYTVHQGVWGVGMSAVWNRLTFTDATQFEGRVFSGFVNVCYRRVELASCAKMFKGMLSSTNNAQARDLVHKLSMIA